MANSECRKILIKVETDVNFNQEVNDPQDDNMDIDDPRPSDNVQDMDTEPPPEQFHRGVFGRKLQRCNY